MSYDLQSFEFEVSDDEVDDFKIYIKKRGMNLTQYQFTSAEFVAFNSDGDDVTSDLIDEVYNAAEANAVIFRNKEGMPAGTYRVIARGIEAGGKKRSAIGRFKIRSAEP